MRMSALRWRGAEGIRQTRVVVEQVTVRPAVAADDISSWIRRSWGDTVMAVHGRLYDTAMLPALVALAGGTAVGVLTYHIEDNALEIVSCDADPPGRGVGRSLVRAAVDIAGHRSLRRVWCTTTNDNLVALGFWQAIGFSLVDLRPGAVDTARQLKATIPLRGYLGLPIRDELDLELHTHLGNDP
jgi:GNAT superfamily N-acetyltransferase